MNLKTGKNKFYTGRSESRYIAGFSKDGKNLILAWHEGDADCIWGNYESISLEIDNLNSLGEFGYCFTSDENDESYVKYLESFVGMQQDNHFIIDGGKIYVPQEFDDMHEGELIRYDELEYKKK